MPVWNLCTSHGEVLFWNLYLCQAKKILQDTRCLFHHNLFLVNMLPPPSLAGESLQLVMYTKKSKREVLVFNENNIFTHIKLYQPQSTEAVNKDILM